MFDDLAPCSCHVEGYGCGRHGPQPREHAVFCRVCWCRTWRTDGYCDACAVSERLGGGANGLFQRYAEGEAP